MVFLDVEYTYFVYDPSSWNTQKKGR